MIDSGKYKNWESINDIVNEQLREDESLYRTESAYRKRYAEGKGWYEDVFAAWKNDEYIRALEEQRIALQKERYKLQATKLEMVRNTRRESRFELFYENVKETIQRLELPVFYQIEYRDSGSDEFVLSLADIHYGASFKSKNNEYSRDICKKRFERLLMVLKDEISVSKISKIKIINVADTIQGLLRFADLQINDIAVVESVVEVSRIISIFLNELSSVCEIDYYHISAANHSQTRPLGSKASEIASEDMEKIIVSYISDLLANNSRVRVVSDLDKEYLTFDIFDFKAIAIHGHQIKNVQTAIKDISNLHRTFYDYLFLGHRHSANEIIVAEGPKHNIEILTCPSFIGSDPYSDNLKVGSKAMCKLYEFNQIYGHVGSKNIILN